VPSGDCAGSLTGDLFVTTQSGDIKRAADVDVLLVPATQEFERQWERLQSEYEERIRPATEYASLKAQEELARANSNKTRNVRVAIDYIQQSIDLMKQMLQIGREQWTPLQKEYGQAAMQLIAKSTTARAATDVNGHFEVSLRSGRYYVFCQYQLPRRNAVLVRDRAGARSKPCKGFVVESVRMASTLLGRIDPVGRS